MSLCDKCAATRCGVRDKRGAEIQECKFFVEDIGVTGRWRISRNMTDQFDESQGAGHVKQ